MLPAPIEGDVCETFQALHSEVLEIKLTPAGRSEMTGITIYLSSAPLIGNSRMKLPEKAQPITLLFDLRKEDTKRFLESLRNRGLVCPHLPKERFGE